MKSKEITKYLPNIFKIYAILYDFLKVFSFFLVNIKKI